MTGSHRASAATTTSSGVRSLAALAVGLVFLFIGLLAGESSYTASAAKAGPGSNRSIAPANAEANQDKQGSQSSQGSQGISEGQWTNLYPELFALAVVSSTQAWAVGEYGRLLHMSDGVWNIVDPPELRGYNLTDVDALADGTVWAAGENKVFQFDGTHWWDRSMGLGPSWEIALIDVVSDEDIWVTGGGGVLAHWEGTQWEQVSLPHTRDLPFGPFRDIEMLSESEGWLLGDDHSCGRIGCVGGPVVLQYSEGVWSEISSPADVNVSIGLYSLSVTPSGELWMAGADNSGHVVYRYSNGSWQSWAVSNAFTLSVIEMLSPTQGWIAATTSQGIPAIWVWDGVAWELEYQGRHVNDLQAVDGQVWAVGYADTILSRSTADGSWSQQRGGPVADDLRDVDATVASGPDEFWAIGEGPSRHFDFPATYYILHYSNGTWSTTNLLTTPEPVPFGEAPLGIDILSPQSGWAWAGNRVFQYNGSAWQDSSNGIDPGWLVSNISAVAPDDAWAVVLQTENTSSNGDDHSGILHWDGTSWQIAANLPVYMFLTDLDMVSATEGWAVGEDRSCCGGYKNLLWRYDGTEWRDSTHSLPPGANIPDQVSNLRGIELVPGSSEGWAVGWGASVLHLQAGTWGLEPRDKAGTFRDVALEALGEAWFFEGFPLVGHRARAHHYAGGTFQEQGLPLGGTYSANHNYLDVHSIAIVPGRGGWIVGDGGTILRYDALGPGQRYYDVPVGSTFYSYIESLASRNIVSGYAEDNTFRPANPISRGQLAKIVSNSADFAEDPGAQRFQDVPPDSPFYVWVQRLAARGYIGGYPCGGPDEPCVGPDNLPYFRSGETASRGQISKIVANAAGLNDPAGARIYTDVPEGSTFYDYVQRLSHAGVLGGYQCGGVGEPCDKQNRPYFRPGKEATRGQVAKIVSNTFFPAEASSK